MAVAAGPLRAGRSAPDAARREARRKSLLYPLERLASDFRARMRAGLRARGHALRPAHARVIVHLGTEGSRLTALAERAGASKQAMGKLVDEMEAIGYVERMPDPADGRAKCVRFSPAGLGLLRDAAAVVDEIWAEYAGLVGDARLRALRDTLGLLLERLGDAPAPGSREEETA